MELNQLIELRSQLAKLYVMREGVKNNLKSAGIGFDDESAYAEWIDSLAKVTDPKADTSDPYKKAVKEIQDRMDKIREKYLASRSREKVIIENVISFMESEVHPMLRDTLSAVQPEVTQAFKGGADLRGATEITLIERLSEMNLPPMNSFEMHQITLALMSELVIEQMMDVKETFPENGRKRQRTVYALMPININSPIIQDVLSGQYSKYFPNLLMLNKNVNQRSRRGLIDLFLR